MMKFVKILIAAFLLTVPIGAFAQTGQLQPGQVWGNPTASKAPATGASLSAMFAQGFCTTQGAILTRNGSAWVCLSPGTVNLPLLSGGAGANIGYAQLPNAGLVNPSTTVNGQVCALGSSCTVTASATAITVGTTTVTGGPGILYNTTGGGTLTALAAVNSSVVSFTSGGVLQASTTLPAGITLVTPIIGVATGTSLALGGCTIGSNVLCTNGAMVATGSVSSTASDANFSAGGNRAVMDIAAGVGRVGAANGGGGATSLQILVGGSAAITISTASALRFNAYGVGTLTSDASGNISAASVATSANYLAGSGTGFAFISPSIIYQTETTTTFGATTTFDFSTFINTVVTLTSNITTQTLSNVAAGKAGSITFIQDATGSRTSVWNSVFKFSGGTVPTLSTTANAVDVLFYSCRSATNCPASLVKDVR